MLKLLMTLAGAEAAAVLKARAERAAQVFAWMLVAGLLALIGLVFLLVAAAIALVPELGPAGAVAAVGGGVLIVAVLAFAIGRSRPPPSRASPLAGLAGLAGAAAAPQAGGDAAAGPPRPGAATVVAAALGTLLVGIVLGRRL